MDKQTPDNEAEKKKGLSAKPPMHAVSIWAASPRDVQELQEDKGLAVLVVSCYGNASIQTHTTGKDLIR